MFSKYFQSELGFLREMGREFGQKHPSIGGMLAERGGDPDVERLLEGVAFLTARIRERADAAVPEVVHGLTELLLPHYLRPLPAATVMEFMPVARNLRSRQLIPKGSAIAATPIDGTSCQFRTTTDVELLPASILDVSLEYPTQAAPCLRVSMQLSESTKGEVLSPKPLRFFLHGELSLTSMLFLWMLRYSAGIEVSAGQGAPTLKLPPTALRAPAFQPNEALLPWGVLAPEGYRLLQEYFVLPQKFLFIEVSGLEAAAPLVKDRVELCFRFQRPPPLPARPGKDILKLHCAPAVNLFTVDADPLRIRALEEEHLLRASEMNPQHMEVYSVDSVRGVRAGRNERREYRPYADFVHAPGTKAFFRLRRAASPVNDGIDTFLSLVAPRDAAPSLDEEVVSAELTCTNRSLPRELRVGDISRSTVTSPTTARFSNILPVTAPVRAPLGGELHWRLLSHLGLQRQTLSSREALKALLHLYNFHPVHETPEGRATALKAESIRETTATPSRQVFQGAFVRGQATRVDVEESGFAGTGDAFLFGCVLDALFAGQATLNAFHALSVRLNPSREEYTWPARSGTQALV